MIRCNCCSFVLSHKQCKRECATHFSSSIRYLKSCFIGRNDVGVDVFCVQILLSGVANKIRYPGLRTFSGMCCQTSTRKRWRMSKSPERRHRSYYPFLCQYQHRWWVSLQGASTVASRSHCGVWRKWQRWLRQARRANHRVWDQATRELDFGTSARKSNIAKRSVADLCISVSGSIVSRIRCSLPEVLHRPGAPLSSCNSLLDPHHMLENSVDTHRAICLCHSSSIHYIKHKSSYIFVRTELGPRMPRELHVSHSAPSVMPGIS